jgi:hypothetical protein
MHQTPPRGTRHLKEASGTYKEAPDISKEAPDTYKEAPDISKEAPDTFKDASDTSKEAPDTSKWDQTPQRGIRHL